MTDRRTFIACVAALFPFLRAGKPDFRSEVVESWVPKRHSFTALNYSSKWVVTSEMLEDDILRGRDVYISYVRCQQKASL